MRRTAIVFSLAFVAACASAPKRQTPTIEVEIPVHWTVDGDTAASVPGDTDWWLTFHDPHLNEFVDEALGHNYDLVIAVARVDAAAAQARIAGADLLPQLALSMQAARSRQNLFGFPLPGQPEVITTRASTFGVSLDLSWEIDLWGRIRAHKSAALADLEASWAELAAVRLSIAGQTAKAWFAVLEAKYQARLAEETVESFETSARQVRDRYESGVRTSLDLRLALSNLAGAEALLELRRQQMDRAIRQLEILLGRYPSGSEITTMDLPTLPDQIPEGLPSELMIRRPDLLAAERRFAANEARVSEARRAFFPRISLTASGGTLSGQLEDLVQGDFGVWSIAAGLVQPIFQGGRLRANLSQSHAFSDQTLAQYVRAMLVAFGEVETTLYAEGSLARQEDHLAEAALQSRAARELAERQYDAGIVGYVTVLETQRRELNSRSELIAVRRLRLDARVNLHLARGGGFDFTQEWTEFLQAQNNAEGETTDETED
jgi:NodT family efflux transporter outer membrane factor (OMF) lipoprotein